MDIFVPGMRDRRVAAADETHAPAIPGGDPRPIYGDGSVARRMSLADASHFDVRRAPFAREPTQINTVVLHQMSVFHQDALPALTLDSDISDDHSLDHVIAHFVVRSTGEILYTHDVQYVLNSVSGRRGIDIEFEGRYGNQRAPESSRLSAEAIRSGRRLLLWLQAYLTSLAYIHPHGQLQSHGSGKRDSCPGPDIWVNIGEWAVANLGLTADQTFPGYTNRGITPAQRNPRYDQGIASTF